MPAGDPGLCGLFGAAPVAAHYDRASHHDFADAARGHEVPGLVRDLDLAVADRAADRAGFAQRILRVETAQERGLGQSVALVAGDTKYLLEASPRLLGQVRGADEAARFDAAVEALWGAARERLGEAFVSRPALGGWQP